MRTERVERGTRGESEKSIYFIFGLQNDIYKTIIIVL